MVSTLILGFPGTFTFSDDTSQKGSVEDFIRKEIEEIFLRNNSESMASLK